MWSKRSDHSAQNSIQILKQFRLQRSCFTSDAVNACREYVRIYNNCIESRWFSNSWNLIRNINPFCVSSAAVISTIESARTLRSLHYEVGNSYGYTIAVWHYTPSSGWIVMFDLSPRRLLPESLPPPLTSLTSNLIETTIRLLNYKQTSWTVATSSKSTEIMLPLLWHCLRCI